MLDAAALFAAFKKHGVSFFAGVPDSTLTDFCAFVTEHAGPGRHVVTANEGSAVALAAGSHLATGTVPLVYMQNSGQGNAVNPLTSLAAPEVYGIPMVLLIGWRGEPGTTDEPQHAKQGAITLQLLDLLGIPNEVLPTAQGPAVEAVARAVKRAEEIPGPTALIVRRGTFQRYRIATDNDPELDLSRERAIKILADSLSPDTAIVCTTGKASRELFEHRVATGDESGRDFLTVGSMGHASHIALGAALADASRPICCIDGDGALLMHMGGLAIIGSRRPENYLHVVLNNGCHDSVGGQPTVGFQVDILAIASACGYRACLRTRSAAELHSALAELERQPGPKLLEIRVKRGGRADLGRPTATPTTTKARFARFLRS
jgi:phosphonopyruvate decarboxylase